jgi:DNA helicase-4
MLAHFREDWEKITEGCYDKSKEEFLQFRRSLPRESLSGEPVKSFGEKIIADFLFEHDIPYKYERNHWWSGINYQPDFTLFKTDKSGVVIEYFGLKGDVAYDKVTVEKREYWREKENWNLIEVVPQDITINGADAFLSLLKKRLEEHEFSCVKLSEDEIWHRLKGRAIDRFSKAMKGFVGICRKQSLEPSALQHLIDQYTPISNVEKMFLSLALRFYTSYINRLTDIGEEDFDGLMQRASDAINSGHVGFRSKSGEGNLNMLRHIFIDEFQDFSNLFNQLIQSIRNGNSKIELFCVGDDWQAINGFAGSDLRFFEKFSEHVGVSQRLDISRNYRSSKAIVDIGNALMNGRGLAAMPGKKVDVKDKKYSDQVLVVDKNKFEPTLIETGRHAGDIITPIVLRLVNEALNSGLDVVMLCRTNYLPWYVNFKDDEKARGIEGYLNHVRSFFAKEVKDRISISTAHKYKGLQKSVVIVLDAVARCYPLVHADWAFSRILGNSPEKIIDEERRLLYVALTRAIYKLVVITDGSNKSPFLDDLKQNACYSEINWDDHPPLSALENQRLLVRVSNQKKINGGGTFPIKDLLKASKFRFNSIHKYWEKDFPANSFNIDAMKETVWSPAANDVEVQISDENDSVVARYLVGDGIWECIFDRLDMLCVPRQDSSVTPVNQTNSIFSVEDYSFEYLLGFTVNHDQYGKGKIFSIDDERNTCRVRFENEGEMELSTIGIFSKVPPWDIDSIRLLDLFEAYRMEIDALRIQNDSVRNEILKLKAEAEVLQSKMKD